MTSTSSSQGQPVHARRHPGMTFGVGGRGAGKDEDGSGIGSTGSGSPGPACACRDAPRGAACSARTSDCCALLSRIRSCSRSDSARSTRSLSQSRSAVMAATRSRRAATSGSLPCTCPASRDADGGSCAACGAGSSSGRLTRTRPCAVRMLCSAPLLTRRFTVSTDTPRMTAASATLTWRGLVGASTMTATSLRLRCTLHRTAPHHGLVTARAPGGAGVGGSGRGSVENHRAIAVQSGRNQGTVQPTSAVG
jgi:hypothetical protein